MIKPKPKLILNETDNEPFLIICKAKRVAKENNMDWTKIFQETGLFQNKGKEHNLFETLLKYYEVDFEKKKRVSKNDDKHN